MMDDDTRQYIDRLRNKYHWEQDKIFKAMRWIGSIEYDMEDYMILKHGEGRFVITKEKIQELIDILGDKYPTP